MPAQAAAHQPAIARGSRVPLVYFLLSSVMLGVSIVNAYNRSLMDLTARTILIQFFRTKINVVNLLNMFVVTCYIVFKAATSLTFGPLSETEVGAVRENTSNFILFRVVFMGAILDPDVYELTIWTSWFVVIGALKALVVLLEQRLNTLNMSPNTLPALYKRFLIVSCVLAVINVLLSSWCISFFRPAGWSLVGLLVVENILLVFGTARSIVIYSLYTINAQRETLMLRENLASYVYYVEVATSVLNHLVTLGHFVHVWFFNGLSYSLVDLFIFVSMRSVVSHLFKQINAFSRYRKALHDMQTRFPSATPEELAAANDKCAICREHLQAAKKLPCGHMFHSACLHQWIKYRRICPICRASLIREDQGRDRDHGYEARAAAMQPPPAERMNDVPHGGLHFPFVPDNGLRQRHMAAPQDEREAAAANDHPARANHGQGRGANSPGGAPRGTARSLFRFHSRQLSSWLPNFSLEVVGSQLQSSPEDVAAHVARLVEMFPHVPPAVLAADLARTRSMEATIDNIIFGRYTVPADPAAPPAAADPPPASFPADASRYDTLPHERPRPAAPSSATAAAAVAGEPDVAAPPAVRIVSPRLVDAVPTDASTAPSRAGAEAPPAFGATPDERSTNMAARRQAMLDMARKRLESRKQKDETTEERKTLEAPRTDGSDAPQLTDEERRALSLAAYQRRTQQSQPES